MVRNITSKAEAPTSGKGAAGYVKRYLEIINKVRNRARLKDLDLTAESVTEEEMRVP